MTNWRVDVIPELLEEYEYRPTVRGFTHFFVVQQLAFYSYFSFFFIICLFITCFNSGCEIHTNRELLKGPILITCIVGKGCIAV